MIKLISVDMDGTLLNEKGELPANFFTVLDELLKRNIKFVIASGRSYPVLYELFKPYSEKLSFICDNGAYIIENTNIFYINTLDKNDIKNVIKSCINIPNALLVLCGKKAAYTNNGNNEFLTEIKKYYINCCVVNDLFSIDDEIFKMTVCDLNGAAQNSYKLLYPEYNQNLSVVVSGDVWVDIMNKNINKGSALEKLQTNLNISYYETMAFGDFYNDIEMLQKAHYSFVMDNAVDDIKRYGNFIAASNKDNGVIKAIYEYILK